jgi:hypothetical protein
VRRCFGPVALIHVREVCPRVTSWPEGSPPPVVDAPEGDADPPGVEPVAARVAVVEPVAPTEEVGPAVAGAEVVASGRAVVAV